MNQFENHPDFYNQPIRLTEEQKSQPLEILQTFFQNCHLHEIRRTLWKMLETSLTVRYSIYDDAHERSHLFWFYRELETMIEASYLLCSQLPVPESATSPVPDNTGVRPSWRNKTMLEDEIRSLRIKNAEMETELISLRYFREHGKEFETE